MDKYNFKERRSFTVGTRLSKEDGEKVERLSRKYHSTRCTIVSEIIRVGLKEIKEVL